MASPRPGGFAAAQGCAPFRLLSRRGRAHALPETGQQALPLPHVPGRKRCPSLPLRRISPFPVRRAPGDAFPEALAPQRHDASLRAGRGRPAASPAVSPYRSRRVTFSRAAPCSPHVFHALFSPAPPSLSPCRFSLHILSPPPPLLSPLSASPPIHSPPPLPAPAFLTFPFFSPSRACPPPCPASPPPLPALLSSAFSVPPAVASPAASFPRPVVPSPPRLHPRRLFLCPFSFSFRHAARTKGLAPSADSV